MAFSLFSKKPSFGKAPEGESQSRPELVRTMEEDLENARHGTQEASPSQIEKQETQDKLPQGAAFQKMVNPFSEEGGKVLRTQTKAEEEQSGNPFNVVPQHQNGIVSNVPQSPSLKNGLSGLVPDKGGVLINQPKKGNEALWKWVVGVLALVLISGGVYYFFIQRNQVETAPPPSSLDIAPDVPEQAVEDIPQESPFALDKPNYLTFNTETVTPEDMQDMFSQVALRIKAANIVQPIEFLVTDQNNNPLAFSRFAFLLKLDSTADVFTLIDETFSLYVYNDASRARLGLALTFKDAPAAALALAKTETTLPYAFRALMLESDINVAKITPLQSSVYNQFNIRFANLNDDQTVSFDYVLEGNQWFIGTSKNMLRAILDTYAK